jgi:hypothetical protein
MVSPFMVIVHHQSEYAPNDALFSEIDNTVPVREPECLYSIIPDYPVKFNPLRLISSYAAAYFSFRRSVFLF